MSKRPNKKPNVSSESATLPVAESSQQAALNLAEQAQHTVSTGEDLLVQTARLSVQADERESNHQLRLGEEAVIREKLLEAKSNRGKGHAKAAKA